MGDSTLPQLFHPAGTLTLREECHREPLSVGPHLTPLSPQPVEHTLQVLPSGRPVPPSLS